MKHHTLDTYPVPKDETPMFINEPWIIDRTLLECPQRIEPEEKADNVRIYVPIDLNGEAILRRLKRIIMKYGEANEQNEWDFGADVNMIMSQLEIYDQVWYARHIPTEGKHSEKATTLAGDIVKILERSPDGCAETFPLELIDELKREYGLGDKEEL